MTLSTGDRLPAATFVEIGADGPVAVTTDDLFGGRRVVLFAVPGAFTPTCHSAHVPSFIRTHHSFAAKGIDEIVCVAVNDPFVMRAWGEATGATRAGIRMLSDPEAAFTTAVGMAFTAHPVGLISRSRRYAAFVEDGVVRVLHVETSSRGCEISAGEALLEVI